MKLRTYSYFIVCLILDSLFGGYSQKNIVKEVLC